MASNPRIDELRKRLEKEPGSRLFGQLAEELRKAGELPEAIRVSREGLEKHPSYPSARMTLGRALMDSGELAGARGEFEVVLKGAPDNILASRLLAECLEALGDRAGAAKHYRQTLLLSPGDKQVQARLQALESGPASPAAAAKPAVSASAAVEPTPAAAPVSNAPIPLVAADEPFELERTYESPRGGPQTLPPTSIPEAPAPIPEPSPAPFQVMDFDPGPATLAPAPAPPEPAIVEAVAPLAAPPPEAFELEKPWEVPVPPSAPPPPAAEPAPAVIRVDAPAIDSTAIASATLAELYFNQGFTDKALEVYRELLQREPENERAKARLEELTALDRAIESEAQSEGPAPADAGARRRAIDRTIARLESLLEAVRGMKAS